MTDAAPPSRRARRPEPTGRERRRRRRRAEMLRRRRRFVLALGSAALVVTVAATADAQGGDAVEPAAPAAGEAADLAPPASAPSPAEAPPGPTNPAPVEVPQRAGGELDRVDLALPPSVDEGRVVTYTVDVERGLPFDPMEFARGVHAILGDELGWQGVDGVRFELVASGDTDITVTLVSPDETDRLCAPLRTRGEVSCWNGSRAVINAKRWGIGAESFADDLTGYRSYLINHEVGHGLGKGHVGCPREGTPSPVMVQQTYSTQGCAPNPWPALTSG